jgi:hypothetical protein
MAKTTVIGSSWVMTTIPFASEARTMLPGSTSRKPARPLTGASIREYWICSFAVATLPRSVATSPSVWRTTARCVS